jgi:hypothetical protein
MTPKNFTIIALRLIAIYLFFRLIPLIQSLIYIIRDTEFLNVSAIRYGSIQLVLYIMAIIILFKYSHLIANKIVISVPDESVKTTWTSINLLSILIAASAVLALLLAIPKFISQVYGFSNFYQNRLLFQPEKQRIDESIFEIIGTTLQIVIACIFFYNAKRIAFFWEKYNPQTNSKEIESE